MVVVIIVVFEVVMVVVVMIVVVEVVMVVVEPHLSTPWLEEASSLSLAARSRLWIPSSSE